MEKVKIRAEHLPERCDVCHRSDCFDRMAGHCSRCSDLICRDLKSNVEDQASLTVFDRSPELEYIELQNYLARRSDEPKSSNYFQNFNLQYPITGAVIGAVAGSIFSIILFLILRAPKFDFYNTRPYFDFDITLEIFLSLLIFMGMGFVIGFLISIVKFAFSDLQHDFCKKI
jgi:hypothetical protein